MSTRTMARLAGLLYLIVAVSGGFAQLYARSSVLVVGDAAATAANIRAAETLFLIGIVADVVNIVAFVGVAFLLYAVLSPVRQKLSASFVVLVAMSATIMGVALVSQAGALMVASGPSYAATFGADGADSLSALLLDLHGFGYLIAEVFFGLWLLPLGYVVARSGYFPRMLGIGLVIGSISYLVSFGLSITAPAFTSDLSVLVAMPAAVAELAFMAWLLVRGANVTTSPRSGAGAASPALTEGAAA
jgi:Domain of unknown function (DUF4386)